jgi:hypothetical protein
MFIFFFESICSNLGEVQNTISSLPTDINFWGATAPSEPGPPPYRGFAITLRHTTLGSNPLDE